MQPYKSISITAHHHTDGLKNDQKIALSLVGIGFLLQLVFWMGFRSEGAALWLWLSIGLVTTGSIWYTSGPVSYTHLDQRLQCLYHRSHSQ